MQSIRTSEQVNPAVARQVLLDVVNAHVTMGPGYFQAGPILQAASQRLGIKGNIEAEQVLLTIWHDLFRIGMIAPGYDLCNPDLPFVHMTDAGRASLAHISRDPTNPDGYLAHLSSQQLIDPIALSYIHEAVLAYNSACHKASAVMVGCATERLVLLVRDELVAGLSRIGKVVPKELADWRYKTVRDSVTAELEAQTQHMRPIRLKESFTAFWIPLTEQPRLYRNDAGHPKTVDPVSPETVHSNLLIFPELAKLVADLVPWLAAHYV